MHVNSALMFGGGLEKIIFDLMRNNHEVNNYLCVINDKWSKEFIYQLDRESLLLCNRKEGTKNLIDNFKAVYQAWKFIRKNRITIVHCHDSFSLKFAFLLKVLTQVKVVFTVHSTFTYTEKLNMFPVNQYIAISKAVYKTISKYVPKNKIDLVYNGVDINKFYNSNNKKKIHNAMQEKKVTITNVSRIDPEIKGQDILVNALNVLKNKYEYNNFKCLFAGANNNEHSLNELKLLISNFHLEENIEFLGNVEKVEELYAKTDIFVLPSRSEGFGLVVVEALASGCIVVVSSLEGPLEIVKEDEEFGLLFEKEDYRGLANKLYELINNVELFNSYKYKKETKEYLMNEYSLSKMVEKYNKVYRSCLGEK